MIFNLGMKLNNLNKTRRFLHVEYNIYSDLVTTYLLSGHRDLFQCLRVFIIIKTEFCISFPVSDHVPLALHMPCRKCVVHFGFKWQIMVFFLSQCRSGYPDRLRVNVLRYDYWTGRCGVLTSLWLGWKIHQILKPFILGYH